MVLTVEHQREKRKKASATNPPELWTMGRASTGRPDRLGLLLLSRGRCMNMKELKELIELVAEKQFAEFEMERAGFKVRIRRTVEPPQPVVAAAPLPAVVPPYLPPPFAPPQEGFPAEKVSIAASQAKSAQIAVAAPAETEEELHLIKSPIVGTFYRAASPTAEPFVRVGSQVEVGTVLCIIEAMKLMNDIASDVAGEVVKIFVENGQPVEFGQPLFGIRTD